MQRYERYKPSGVEWLGEIPNHWEVRRNIGVFDERKEANHPEMDLLSVTIKRGIIKQNEITVKKDSSNEDKSKYKVVRKHDLAYNKMRMWQGAIGASDYDGIVSPAYVILQPRDILYSRYYHYLYRTEGFIAEANRHSYGLCMDMNSLRYEDFKTIYSPVPPREDVDRIVTFLNQKTTEIDEAITKKERLINLLQEQKNILINQAVTRGLIPDVLMRESGVDWIGEIPAHWNTIPNRYLFREQNVRSLKGEETHLSMSQRYGLVPSEDLESKTLQSESYDGAKLCNTGDLVQNRLKAHLAVFAVAPCDGLVSPDYSVFRLQDKKNHPLFFERLFKTPIYLSEFNRRVRGIVVGFLRLYSDDFNALPALVPPHTEQESIVQHINQLNSDFGTMQGKIDAEIGRLTELKLILVADATTGKIKV